MGAQSVPALQCPLLPRKGAVQLVAIQSAVPYCLLSPPAASFQWDRFPLEMEREQTGPESLAGTEHFHVGFDPGVRLPQHMRGLRL